jgi:hypothetical protein
MQRKIAMRFVSSCARLASVCALALLPTLAAAEDWQVLDGAAITAALTARTLVYDGGATQTFNADGSTLYTAGEPSTGGWRVEGNQYCSVWPPSDRWDCYDIARSADGLDIRFKAAGGSETVGRYQNGN